MIIQSQRLLRVGVTEVLYFFFFNEICSQLDLYLTIVFVEIEWIFIYRFFSYIYRTRNCARRKYVSSSTAMDPSATTSFESQRKPILKKLSNLNEFLRVTL